MRGRMFQSNLRRRRFSDSSPAGRSLIASTPELEEMEGAFFSSICSDDMMSETNNERCKERR